jgi:nitrogen fixation NifU-like protein
LTGWQTRCGTLCDTFPMADTEPRPDSDTGLDDLYNEAILDHARSPRHDPAPKRSDAAGDAVNPFCGDEAHVQIALSDGSISDLGMQTVGCSINRASGSMLADSLAGLSTGDALAVAVDFRTLMMGDSLPQDRRRALGELALMESVRRFPVRIKCALLALTAVEEALSGVS